ncbi:hypothetical protein GCM10011571_30270 [Marinithermofilum abyssi]|uniref:Pyrroline-5-carboxylate reductase dimerisation domain-containing protein n=1 Tax=Marinithermofilum abyssi TaxID=1571185 RepID=A0A8J2VJM2_9BACL|nr:pyrroline-5-carboxylate reductase dimerization domain-containing protein [Marinithermofilum abyssi]GGE26096.1 hypothetical protein GCM10011571_30270 [Marinithermofilum abyssi]
MKMLAKMKPIIRDPFVITIAAGYDVQSLEKTLSPRSQQVATPGGVTAAGLEVLDEGEFSRLLHNAVHATNQRGKENAAKCEKTPFLNDI